MAGRPPGPARGQILAAADALFGELGFDATTTRRIEERAGVNKALIHYHFKNKDDLFGAVLDGYYAKLDTLLRTRLTGEGGLRDRLRRVVDAYFDFLAEHRGFSVIVQREITLGRHVERIVGHMRPLFELGAALVESAFPGARGGPLAAHQLLLSFYGMVVAGFTYAPVAAGLLDADPASSSSLTRRKAHLHRMLDLVLDALPSEGQIT